jgi:hypothetical protein
MAFPREHWSRISSTNPIERINREIRRRTRVIGIFPSAASALRLIGIATNRWLVDVAARGGRRIPSFAFDEATGDVAVTVLKSTGFLTIYGSTRQDRVLARHECLQILTELVGSA